MAKLSTLQLLRLFKDIRSLSDMPDIHDEDACRLWLKGLIVVLRDVVSQTETLVDDEAVNLLGLIAEKDTVWAQTYKLMFMIVTHESLPGERVRALVQVATAMDSDKETAAEAVRGLSELFTP